jgi:hypothetical protein
MLAPREQPTGRARLDERAWLAIAAVIIALPAIFMACDLNWFFIQAPGFVGFDDGYTAAMGERLIDGKWLPYVDGCSHRGPLLYWLTAISLKLAGRFDWAGPRWMMLVFTLLSIGSMIGTGFAARLPLAGSLAALLFVFIALIGHEPDSAFAITGEAIAAGLGMCAVFWCTWALTNPAASTRTRAWRLALSGFFVACAGFTKQTALPMVVPLGLWVLAAAVSLDGLTRQQRLRLVLAFLGGFAAPIAIVLARYALARELGTFWYWFYTYNAKIYMAPYRDVPFRDSLRGFLFAQPWFYFVVAALSTWGLARPVAEIQRFPRDLFRAYAATGLEVTLSLLTLIVFFALASPKRFWPPYFILVYPFVAMNVGLRAAIMFDRARGRPAAKFAGALVLGALVSGWVAYPARERMLSLFNDRRAGKWVAARPEPICDELDKYSGPDDSLFVWGFDGDYYVTCHRHPATRFTYLTLVAGTVPPFWNTIKPEWVARHAVEDLLADLEKSRPPVVLNSPGTMHDVSMSVVPKVHNWVRERYCQLSDISSKNGRRAQLWVRRDLVQCAPYRMADPTLGVTNSVKPLDIITGTPGGS